MSIVSLLIFERFSTMIFNKFFFFLSKATIVEVPILGHYSNGDVVENNLNCTGLTCRQTDWDV